MNTLYEPLASRLRPKSLEEFCGQTHLLSVGKPLRRAIEQGHLHSMILWGPPGTGKTTLARLLAKHAQAHVESLSAVLAGVKEMRVVIQQAEQRRADASQATVLFIDEIHRFNKAQQDVLLPYVETGVITLIGATTENPSFELNNALLSRTRVYVLKSLQVEDLLRLMTFALSDTERGLGDRQFSFPLTLQQQLAEAADGDARRLLNMLELLADFATGTEITSEILEEVLTRQGKRFDKQGDIFYDQISALHKSVRGTSPDAALYWLVRMLEGGCDPLYLARRMIRMASEDIGNADPRALALCLDACEVYERLGSPEGELALAQAVLYLACAPKSNAVYTAYQAAVEDVASHGSLEVPLHLRNAPTKLMRSLGHGKDYRYAHDEPEAYAAGENYFPEGLSSRRYYFPAPRGLEIKIAEMLERLRVLDREKQSG